MLSKSPFRKRTVTTLRPTPGSSINLFLPPSLSKYLDKPSLSSPPPSLHQKDTTRSLRAGHSSKPFTCSSRSPEPPRLHLHMRRRGAEILTSLPKATPPAWASEPRSPSSQPQHCAHLSELGRWALWEEGEWGATWTLEGPRRPATPRQCQSKWTWGLADAEDLGGPMGTSVPREEAGAAVSPGQRPGCGPAPVSHSSSPLFTSPLEPALQYWRSHCKPKPPCGSPSHLAASGKQKQKTASADEDGDATTPGRLAGMWDGAATVENGSAVPRRSMKNHHSICNFQFHSQTDKTKRN